MKMLPAIILSLLLSACVSTAASNPDADPFELQDPIQPVNSAVFDFNLSADQYVIKPVTDGYHYLPEWSRYAISNFVTNLSEPSNFVNGVLQADPNIAFTSIWRFILNSTFGFAGLRDFAAENGLKYQNTNFGKTLGVYGFSDGAYVVLPLAGPSTVRDTAGTVVDWFIDPLGWYLTTPEIVAQTAVDGITTRDENDSIIDQLYYRSLDPYSATRAAYLQHQAFEWK